MTNLKSIIFLAFLLNAGVLFSGNAFAQEAILCLVSESEEGQEDKFWWKEATPNYTVLDKELASSFRPKAVALLQPKKALSRVYRTKKLGSEKAKRIGSLFGAKFVIHGNLALKNLPDVDGQKGMRADLDITFLGSQKEEKQKFVAFYYADDPARLRIEVKRLVANQLVEYAQWASEEKSSGGVGYTLSQLDFFLENGNSKIINELKKQFSLNKGSMKALWASESGIAFRVTGVAPNAVQRIIERINTENVQVVVEKKGQGFLVKGQRE